MYYVHVLLLALEDLLLISMDVVKWRLPLMAIAPTVHTISHKVHQLCNYMDSQFQLCHTKLLQPDKMANSILKNIETIQGILNAYSNYSTVLQYYMYVLHVLIF